MACNSWEPVTCAEHEIGNTVASAVPSAWGAICKSFAQAAADVLTRFAHAFTSIPSVTPGAAGIHSVYLMSLALAALVAMLLVFGQVIRTAWTADGSGLAQALSGGGKAVMAWMATAAVATAALQASNNITDWIVAQTARSQGALAVRLANIVNWSQVAGQQGGQAAVAASLLLIVSLVGIVLVIVLWFELLLRNAAIAILIAMSPIPAAGQMAESTKVWWQRTCSSAVQLIIMKPVIAIVFAVGFAMSGNSRGVEAVLEGLLVLVLAVFSWPVVARFFTFATIQASSSGLSTALGFALGRASGGGGGGGPAGQDPQRWSLGAEQRTMASRGGGADGAAGPEGGLAGGGPGGAPGGGPAAGGAGSGGGSGGSGFGAAAAGIVMALQAAHNAGSALAGRMEQTAGHAGMHGAYPYSTVGGSSGRRARRQGYGSGQGGTPVNPGGTYGNQGPQAEAPDEPTAPQNRQTGPQNRRPVPEEPNAASPGVPPNVPADSSMARGDVPGAGGQPGSTGQRPAGQAPGSPPSTGTEPRADSAPPPANSGPREPGPPPDIREEHGSDPDEGDQP